MTKRILTVDDSRTIRDMLAHYLQQAGFEVVSAVDGSDGVEKFQAEDVDLVITDINMPVMDGYELIENIRSGDSGSRVPILVLSTESSDEKKMRAKIAGATGWIVKPFEPDSLIKAVKVLSLQTKWQR